jgi:hypothetical protein
MAITFLFYLHILDKITFIKVPYISEMNYHKSFWDCKLSGVCVSPTSNYHFNTDFRKLKGCDTGVAFSGMTYVPSVVKIVQLVQSW